MVERRNLRQRRSDGKAIISNDIAASHVAAREAGDGLHEDTHHTKPHKRTRDQKEDYENNDTKTETPRAQKKRRVGGEDEDPEKAAVRVATIVRNHRRRTMGSLRLPGTKSKTQKKVGKGRAKGANGRGRTRKVAATVSDGGDDDKCDDVDMSVGEEENEDPGGPVYQPQHKAEAPQPEHPPTPTVTPQIPPPQATASQIDPRPPPPTTWSGPYRIADEFTMKEKLLILEHNENDMSRMNMKWFLSTFLESTSSYMSPDKLRMMISAVVEAAREKNKKAAQEAPASAHGKAGRIECDCCTEEVLTSDAQTLECGCTYCGPCLAQLFTSFLEGSEPGHCCHQLCLTTIRALVQRTLFGDLPAAHKFQARLEKILQRTAGEKLTKNPLRCHKCDAWIELGNWLPAGTTATCAFEFCRAETCKVCKGKAHDVGYCPQDAEVKGILEHAEENGWTKCPGCGAFHAKDEGCAHVDCLCGTEFCYLCGDYYALCQCPWKGMPTAATLGPEAILSNISEETAKVAAAQAYHNHDVNVEVDETQLLKIWECPHNQQLLPEADVLRSGCSGCRKEFLWYSRCTQCGLSGVCNDCWKVKQQQ